MLMNHKNFRFTPIPDKTNDMIFLKVQKPCFGAILTIFGHFRPMGIFPKNLAVTHSYIRMPNTMLSFKKKLMSQFQENLWTDRPTLFHTTLQATAGGPVNILCYVHCRK